ncbi:MAG: sigma-54-dependent transcriptional regulator [Pseudomonadota bacterium]
MIARVLLVEDSPSQAAVYAAYLPATEYRAEVVGSAEEALECFDSTDPHAVVLDLGLPGMQGLELLPELLRRRPGLPCIVITDHASAETVASVLKAGAFDVLTKPFGASRLLATLRNALRQGELAAMVESYRDRLGGDRHGFVGRSPAMQAVYRTIDAAGPSRATVFVTGESGTGKELCARAVHAASPRRSGPFVAINCAALPRELIEAELFGHVRGAYTGAHRDREGAAGHADGGTLFLDEIGELELGLQSKLLRFVQTGEYQRVGDGALRRADVRLVCATNRDPFAEVRAGRFREDLYYRLHVVPLALPPLRDRADDVLLLARHFLRQQAREEGRAFVDFAPDAQARLCAHDWPGNVRELEHVIRNAVVLNDAPYVSAAMLALPSRGAPADAGRQPAAAIDVAPAAVVTTAAPVVPPAVVPAAIRPLAEVEREYHELALEACGGHVPRAAAALGVSPSTLYRKLHAWERGSGTARSA